MQLPSSKHFHLKVLMLFPHKDFSANMIVVGNQHLQREPTAESHTEQKGSVFETAIIYYFFYSIPIYKDKKTNQRDEEMFATHTSSSHAFFFS